MTQERKDNDFQIDKYYADALQGDEKGFENLLKEAEQKNNPVAWYLLGKLHQKHIEPFYEKLNDKFEYEAQEIGEDIEDLRNVRRYFYKKAADAEHVDAMLALGESYGMEPRKRDQAIIYLTKALEAGNDDALLHMGDAYTAGFSSPTESIPPDYKKAFDYFLQAAKKDVEGALFRMIGLRNYFDLHDQEILEKYINDNYQKNIVIFLQAMAEATEITGDVRIALNELKKLSINKRDYFRQIIEDYQRGALHGNVNSVNMLCLMFNHGLGVEKKDFKLIIEYYQKSALQGNTNSLNILCMLFNYGLGVKENDFQSIIQYYLEQAKQKGKEGLRAVSMLWNLNNRLTSADDYDIQIVGNSKLVKAVEQGFPADAKDDFAVLNILYGGLSYPGELRAISTSDSTDPGDNKQVLPITNIQESISRGYIDPLCILYFFGPFKHMTPKSLALFEKAFYYCRKIAEESGPPAKDQFVERMARLPERFLRDYHESYQRMLYENLIISYYTMIYYFYDEEKSVPKDGWYDYYFPFSKELVETLKDRFKTLVNENLALFEELSRDKPLLGFSHLLDDDTLDKIKPLRLKYMTNLSNKIKEGTSLPDPQVFLISEFLSPDPSAQRFFQREEYKKSAKAARKQQSPSKKHGK